MSFKREGDDTSQLNLLKKRRVAELLTNDIPDDEAFLMRNGRYACTVCSYRPVFDTVDMLAVHRQGKKHQKSEEFHYARKRSFALEVLKRKQEREFRAQEKGESSEGNSQVEAPLLQKTRLTVKNALLKAAPYDGRSKAHQRKTTADRVNSEENKGLFFQSTRHQHLQIYEQTQSQSDESTIIEATQPSSLPGNPGHASTSSIDSSSEGSSNHQHLAKERKKTEKKRSIFAKEEVVRAPIQLQPYIPKSKRKSCDGNTQPENADQSKCNKPSPAQGYKHSDNIDMEPKLPERTINSIITLTKQNTPQSALKSLPYSSQYQHLQNSTPHNSGNLKFSDLKGPCSTSEPSVPSTDCKTPGAAPRQDNVKNHPQPPQVTIKRTAAIPFLGNDKKTSSAPVPFNRKTSAHIKFTISKKATSHPQVNANKTSPPPQQNEKKVAKTSATCATALEQVRVALTGEKTEKSDPDKYSNVVSSETTAADGGMTDTRRSELQHYLHLTSSGWKRDNGGTWIKDEEVEFDSDEEEPS